ncbi:MAG: MBL fold metallo-hydrolase [Pseudomonadota bacterium]|jgi:cyclase|nr:MAG: hypothetical protein DIU56_00935 [Pseudomonadota bacterium]
MSTISRRLFLERALQGAALASAAGLTALAPPVAAAREARAQIASTPLTDDLVLLTGAGCNVLALRAAEGLLLVDGGLERHSAALLREAARGAPNGRLRVLFNTHWHPEAIGCNARAAKAGATIIAHENTRLWLGRPINVDWLEETFQPLPPKHRPGKTTYKTDTLSFGGEGIVYAYMRQAHTDGDIYVYFKGSNVLATGGVVSADGWPLLDYQTGGWIGGLVAGYDRLLEVANDSTRVVPGNGPLLTRADLEAHRKMYFTIYERLVDCLNGGLSPEETIAKRPAQEFESEWGNPDRFIDSAFRSLWGHYAPDA